MKILIADDNPDNIELVTDILSMAQYEVITATNGPLALQQAQENVPDLVLLDINMPGMTGFEVCRQLKTTDVTAHIPVIMLTALADVDNRVEGLDAGADDYLTKPFSPRELLARIERSLRAKEMTDDLRVKQEIIRNTFQRFVAAPIVQQMLQNPEAIKLGGKLQPITVLFADLEGFTGLSEHTEPEHLLNILNAYHEFVVRILLQYGGTIDKFIGDGVMALYNTPLEKPHHVADAVKSALHIQDELYWFHQKLEPTYRLKINFGIHTGIAVVGNVGTPDIMDFTAVGDAVNVASRLQNVAKNGEIIVSAPVYNEVAEFAVGRYMGKLTVKNRQEPIEAYELSNTMPIE